jgi:ribosomal 30S subunit maturation factor RimM
MHPKHRVGLTIEKNALGDEGEGIIMFPGSQVIIDGQKLRNGYQYDIDSMVLDEYAGQVTADHWDAIDMLVGKVINCRKEDGAVKIDGIQFAMNSASGRLAHDLMAEGFLTDMSVETYGPWPDQSDDTYYKAKLIGLSVVVVGNSRSARVKQLVRNSLAKAKEDGLDITAVEAAVKVDPEPEPKPKPEPRAPQPAAAPAKQAASTATKQVEQPMFKTIKNSRDFAIKITYKNAAGDEVSTELAPGATVDVSEDQAEAVENQITKAEVPKPDFKADIAEAVNAAVAPLSEKLTELEKKQFNSQAKAPEVQKANPADAPKAPGVTKNKFEDMDWRERVGFQINASITKDFASMQKLHEMNQYHLEKLKEAKVVNAAITLDSFSGFVLPPEMITEIQGVQSNYQPLLAAFPFQETLRTKMTWLERDGEIEMEDVSMIDEGTDTNLKPIKDYGTTTRDTELTEFAAVTPVDASAIRFSAIDVVADIAAAYRRAYDSKLAQSIIGRLEQAVEYNGNSVPFSLAGGEVSGLTSLIDAWAEIAEFTPDGTFLLSTASVARIMKAQVKAGTNGPLVEVFTKGPDGRSLFLDRPYILVPSSLLPTIDTTQTKSLSFEGDSVTVNSGIFYVNPSVWKGRVSGGLSYSVSDQAAYEQGSTVKSAFQRDQVLFRGYGYRASAILDRSQVSAIGALGVS